MPGTFTVLNIAEKPSVARALAGVFAQTQGARDVGPIRGQAAQMFQCDNVTFPFVLTQGDGRHHGTASNRPHTMITTSVRGHLASQDFGPSYGWSSCPPSSLFEAPIEITYSSDMEPLKNMLQSQSRKANAIILWLDCDREGEAICEEVRTVCLQGNAGLRDKIYRAKFSTVMPQEIRRALQSLGRINECFVQAVQARSEHDLRVGAAFTRFQTLRLQKNFDEFANGSQGVVSYGPCQFPTLGFVVERWARIETFIPEDFWYIEMSIKVNADGTIMDSTQQNNGVQNSSNRSRPIYLKWKRGRLFDQMMTMSLYESCLDAGEATVVSLTGRPKNKWRPIPLATVELQKRASRYLRIGSERVMSAADELYQAGLISYPRTETEKFRPEFQHIPLIQSFQQIDGIVGEYSARLLDNNNFQNPRAGPNDDQAHPPITPCKAVEPESIGDRTQRDIYVLVVKHYLACCSRDAVGKETVLTVKMASEEFNAKGLMVLERNWLEIYSPWERWSTGQGELPTVEIGSRIIPNVLLMKDGRTSAPLPISEVELISLMDRNGIGTDATIAQHITTIQERAYAMKDNNQKFVPTKLGIALVEGYNSMGYQLNRPDLRREMEAECNAVAAGRKRKDEIIGPILRKMLDCFNTAQAEARKLDEAVARHFTRIGTNDANSSIVQRNFSYCGGCEGMTTLKELRAGNNRTQGNGRSNNNNRALTKILHCGPCSLGLKLPRGVPTPMTNAQNEHTKCPICNYQVIKLNQGDGYTGNGYQICPKCFSDPPNEHGGAATGGEFRCFQCCHPTCSLAGGTTDGDIEIFPCPFCEGSGTPGKIALRKNSRGHVLSCSNYATSGGSRCDYTIWLPKEASSISTVEDDSNRGSTAMNCSRCSRPNKIVRKLKFKWKSGSVPPGYGRELVTCILCDEGLKTDFRVSIPQQNRVRIHHRGRNESQGRGRGRSSNTAGRSRERNFGSGGRGRGRGQGANSSNNAGGIICFRCNQPGHYASSCPNARQ